MEDSPARHFVLHYEYSPDFGMLYDSIPWVLLFSNGWFWGIPLLISHERYLITEKKWRKREIDSFRKINGKDMAEKMNKFEKILRIMRIIGYNCIFILSLFLLISIQWHFV